MKLGKLYPALLLALLHPVLLSAQEAKPAETTETAATLLRPQFFPGKIYNYVTETSVRMQLPAQPGQAAPVERQVTMEHHARLNVGDGSDESGVSIEASTDRLTLEIAAGEKKITYDSKGDPSETPEALARHFEGATKRTMALELDANGKIVKAEEQGGGGSATPLPGLPQFGPDELKQLVAGMVQGFPPDPVKPGDEWVQKGKRSLGQFGEIDFEMTYRYVADEEFEGAQCARIEYTGGLKGDVEVKGLAEGTPGKLGFEGTELNGKLMFDKLRKAVRLSEQDVKMRVEAPTSATASGKITLPMIQKVSSKLVSLQDG